MRPLKMNYSKENFGKYVFTDHVKKAQSEYGSREIYEKVNGPDQNEIFHWEIDFITQRDSFHLATVNEDGWPYVQFRGGPKGFLKVIDSKTIGYADYSGNRQYVSTGNMFHSEKVSLILIDYASQIRMKVLARAEVLKASEHPELKDQLTDRDYKAKVERYVIFHLVAFERNCHQHITPKFSKEEIKDKVMNDPEFRSEIFPEESSHTNLGA